MLCAHAFRMCILSGVDMLVYSISDTFRKVEVTRSDTSYKAQAVTIVDDPPSVKIMDINGLTLALTAQHV